MKTTFLNNLPTYEFHIAKKIRAKYEIDASLFSKTGNVVFANFYEVRLLTEKINKKRSIENHISPGELNAAGLIDEIFHIAIDRYFRKLFPNAFDNALISLNKKIGNAGLELILLDFINIFPPNDVFLKRINEKKYLNGFTFGRSNKEILIEELILLSMANKNYALKKIKEFFDENYFRHKDLYRQILWTLKEYFSANDYKFTVGNKTTDLFEFLSEPLKAEPADVWKQLEFIKNNWGILLDENLLRKILSGKDLLAESIVFTEQPFFGGGAPAVVPQYKGKPVEAENLVLGKSHFKYAEESLHEYDEPEQFTPDTNWMPNLVLIAKNIYVWLDQLSKKYRREIKTLDKIPLEELQQLKKWNINGLWLIGIWERSPASKKIKHLMGNTDAVASAYSLYDYEIAKDLGGEAAYEVFNKNAKLAGIRLASDMVPNHTGIYSKWIIEHPEYFIQLDKPPFPGYSFNGPNLSDDPDIEIRIEDGYYEMKDAAVVFERLDLRTKQARYIYHGNDGTNMPWNDTAQLNLMMEEVREALIQKIFDVAKKFSVIRFDAAMTLAKKHYSRLWFPEPGKGGDIPSRSDFAMTREQFEQLFPKEFWREVVDRINNEMPETLLLAEAFWLMEGYFVRTLGMHRVYNSAFMNMMMKEENAKYRKLITNTLEFEPEILKRYVNFMSNPDEETAIEQFGTDDKYFGVLILMCTLPGLPMFAHGQIEGFTEKYGMEYKRAYYNEDPKQWFVERHEREIFPVLKLRYLFSEVKNFWFFDFVKKTGSVNENVFVYSNANGQRKGLVIFNNSYRSTSGRFLYSRLKLTGLSTESDSLHNTTIAEVFKIKDSDFHFYIFKDITSGLEYIFNGAYIHKKGLYFKLKGYEYRVFIDVDEILDTTGVYYHYSKSNLGKGIANVRDDIKKIRLNPVHNALLKMFDDTNTTGLFKLNGKNKYYKKNSAEVFNSFKSNFGELLDTIEKYYALKIESSEIENEFNKDIKNICTTKKFVKKEFKKSKVQTDREIRKLFSARLNEELCLVLTIFATIKNIKKLFDDIVKIKSVPDLRLTIPIRTIISKYVEDEDKVTRFVLLLNILLQYEDSFEQLPILEKELWKARSGKKLFAALLSDDKRMHVKFLNNEFVQSFINVNEYKGKIYYSKEYFEELLGFLFVHSVIKYFEIKTEDARNVQDKTKRLRFVKKIYQLEKHIIGISVKSKYMFKELQKELSGKE